MEIRLHYVEKGSGTPLIFLHGNGEDHSYFTRQIEFFSGKYRVIAVDTRGHGCSPRGEKPFTIRQFAEDLYDFLEEHAISKAHILGFSDGANIAIVFALRHPERVDRLILNGANLNPQGVRASTQIPVLIGYKIASLFAKRWAGAMKNAEMLGLMVNDPHIVPEALEGISARTLVLAGTKDMIKEKHTIQIYEHLPNAELTFLSGGHFIAAKNAPAFNAAVWDFLEKT